MKRNTSLISLCSMLLLVFIIILTINMNTFSIYTKEISIISVLSALLVILICNFGIKKDNNYLKGFTIRTVISYTMIFIILIYGLGIILGFARSYLVLDVKREILNIIPITIILVLSELLKKVAFSRCFDNTKIIIMFTTLIAAVLVLYEINIGALQSAEDKFIFLCTIILPIMAQEFVCSYMTYKVSWIPSLIYKLVLNLYVYLLPIIPNLGDYLYSVFTFVLPFVIYFSVNKMVIKYEKIKGEFKKAYRYVHLIPLSLIIIIMVLLISGIFKYKLVAIASDSMKPVFARGDAVIYEKIDVEQLNEGDIIAFTKDNIIVTHRIEKIWKKGDLYYFVTKGDNNNSIDAFRPTENNVLGRVICKFKYIGYPTVLINEMFRKE